MFIIDSLFISGFRWVLNTIVSAADAEMNDDTALRDQLLAAEMRRETGEISDAEFRTIEADLLARIREIRTRREGGSGPIALEVRPGPASGTRYAVEASVAGEFHEPTNELPDRPSNLINGANVTNRTHSVRRRSRSPRSSRKIRKT